MRYPGTGFMRQCLIPLLILALPPSGAAAEIDFSHDIAPLLKKHCGECHTGSQKKGGFSLNTRETLLAGGESGDPAVVAGKVARGVLLERLTTADNDLRMPP